MVVRVVKSCKNSVYLYYCCNIAIEMKRLKRLYATSVGKKIVAAVTGLILFGFLVGHVAGNLKVFTGTSKMEFAGEAQEVPHIDEYGHFLRVAGEPLVPKYFTLWTARLVLLAALVLHVVSVIQLARQNQSARPVGYFKSKKAAATLPALYMMVSGVVILGFIIFHILHLTTGTISFGSFEHGFVFNNLSSEFSIWPVALGYAIVMCVLAFHLYHGVWSLFQTLGLDNPDRNRTLRMVAMVAAIGIAAGFATVPLAFMSGAIGGTYEYSTELLNGH